MRIKSFLTSAAIVLTWALFMFGYVWLAMSQIDAGREAEAAEGAAAGELAETGNRDFIEAALAPASRPLSPYFVCTDASDAWPSTVLVTPVVRLASSALVEHQAALFDASLVPIIVLDMRETTLETHLDRLRSAAALGVSIRLIELGDVDYRASDAAVAAFPAVTDYVTSAEAWASAIQDAFPEAIIAVAAAPPFAGGNPRLRSWNEHLLPIVERDSLAMAFDLILETGLRQQAVFTREFVRPLLGRPHTLWQLYQRHEFNSLTQVPAPTPILLTTWLQDAPAGATVSGSWAESLLLVTQYLLALENSQVVSVCGGGNGANRIGLQQLSLATANMSAARRLDFEGIRPIPLANGESFRPVLGWRFEDDAGKTALFVNLSADPMFIQLPLTETFPDRFIALRSNPTQPAPDSPDFERVRGEIDTGRLILPSYSIVRLFN